MSEWVKIADREPKPNTNVLLWRSGWQARTGYKGAVSGGYILWGFVAPPGHCWRRIRRYLGAHVTRPQDALIRCVRGRVRHKGPGADE